MESEAHIPLDLQTRYNKDKHQNIKRMSGVKNVLEQKPAGKM